MKLFQRHNIESTSTICKLRHSDTIKIITQSITGDTKELDFTYTCDITTREGVDFLRNFLKEFTDRTSSEESLKYRSVEIRLPVTFLNFLKVNTHTHEHTRARTHIIYHIPSSFSALLHVFWTR